MEESLRLSAEQKLQQRLSPLQVKFVRMLEMNGPEVEDEVRHALDDNPALAETELPAAEGQDFTETPDEMQQADYRNEEETPFYHRQPRPDREFEPVVADSVTTLAEVLEEQLAGHTLSPGRLETARYIIGNLDDNGYLTRSPEQIAFDIESATGRYVEVSEVREMLDEIRSLDPAGVGATDLRDCLLLQLKRLRPSPAVSAAYEIVDKMFNEFTHKHYDRLRSRLGLTEEQLRGALAVITALNPKPAGAVADDPGADRSRHIVPDFQVDVADDSTVTLSLLNNIPELTIEESFREPDPSRPLTPSERSAEPFIRQKREEAAEFIRLLRMRQETLFKVMRAIITLQMPFFTGGDDETLIRPMILKDVAALTGYDLSVISRATGGKYVATAHGIYPLKHFFNERRKEDDDASAHEVMTAMRAIVDTEDKRHPLSDEALADALSEKGYNMARRTVTKYRERLDIPVARLRREL